MTALSFANIVNQTGGHYLPHCLRILYTPHQSINILESATHRSSNSLIEIPVQNYYHLKYHIDRTIY